MSDDKVLGKRKQREDGDETVSGSTVFVSNLPYAATSTDLQTLFSDLAPVRSAFVVLSENVSKGVGYVSFAIKEDAKMAMETIEKEGLKLNGRLLRVQWADRKFQNHGEKNDSSAEKSLKMPSKSKPPIAKVDKDPDAIRTVMISGLANTVDKKMLWKKIRKLNGAESVEMYENGEDSARAVFSTPAQASHAVEKLHAHIFKGFILSATLKKRVEALAKVSNGTAAPNRGSRLIVRNVPWNITEQDLRALFLPYGPIYSITIPKISPDPEEPTKKQLSRGFVFIWFYSKKDAEKAIGGVNGREVVAGAVLAPTLNKKERARQRRKARQEAATEAGDSGEEDDESSEDEENDQTDVPKAKGRVLAVDWALSKEKWEKAKEDQMDEDNSGIDEGSVLGSSSAEESGSGSNSSNADSDESDAEDVNDTSDIDERSDTEEAGKPVLPQTDVGTTVFVRNVPFEATEDEVRVLFRAFGPLRYVRITVDAETGRSRGTGFACFWNKEDANTAIQQAELLNREALASSSSGSTKNPFSLPSLLTPDPSSSLAQSLVLHGRTLSVTRAVTREDASRLKDEGERAREKADKRNLYLLREGVIFPNSPAASSISASELEKRNASFSTRRNLLKSNPSLFVSKTRLSIRQLPLYVSDRALKRLGVHAVRAFEEEAKEGSRQPISADELFADRELEVDGGEGAAKTKAKKKGERETGVRQAKIVRQGDRVDLATGKGRSRGYGFLEMKRHSDALRVLRWANNNKTLFSLFEEWWKAELRDMINGLEKAGNEEGRKADEDAEARLKRLKHDLERLENSDGKKDVKTLVVEFSIENTQVVKRRKEKIEVARNTQSEGRANEEVGDDSSERRPQKKHKPSSGASVAAGKTAPARKDAGTQSQETNQTKSANPLGSMIGRKRKMRRAKGRA